MTHKAELYYISVRATVHVKVHVKSTVDPQSIFFVILVVGYLMECVHSTHQ